MMKLFRPGGAISVFLIIILVPCLVLCFLYVDLSRIELSKSSVESTADTTLNSLMANYDTVLSDYYGLVASVQNIDDFCDKSKEFFKKTLEANGVSDSQSNEIVSWVFSQIQGGGDYSDLLQGQLVSGTENLYAVAGSGIGENPALVKEGVVEFMKYRAPEMAVESIYDKLVKDGDTLKNDLKNSSEDSELAQSREDFSETEGALSKAEFYTYYYYQQYARGDGSENSSGPSKNEITEIRQYVEQSIKDYEDITKTTVGKLWISKAGTPSSVNKYYIGLSSTEGNDGIVKNLATGTGGYNEKKVAKDVKSFEKDKKYYIKWSKVENQKQEVANKLAELETALDNADKAVSKYADKNYGTGDDQANKAQWYYFAYNAAKDSIKDVNSKGDALAKAWVTYTAMLDCEADPDDSTFPSDWKKDERAYSDEIKADVHTIFNGDFPDSGLNGHGGKYMTVKNALVDIYNGGVLSEYDTSGVSSKLNDIATNLAAYREKIQSYIDALSLAIEGDGNKHKITKKHELLSLDELSDLVWEYYSDYNDWKGNATESKTSLGTEQRTEVGTYEKEKRDVDGDDVVEFKNKLIKEREALQSIVDAIDSIKYGSKKLTDIKNFDTFYSQFKNKFTNPTEPIRNSRIDIDGHDIYYKLLTPQKTEALIPVPECKLILEKGDDTYYDFLLTRGYESDGKSLKDLKKDVDEKDGKIDDFKKQKEDAENSEDTKKDKSGSDEIKNSSNVNVGEYEGSKFGAGTLLKGFAQTIENFANQKGPNVRDSLYATLYTMNMFSYRTYVYEGKYDDYTDSYGDEITYENCEEKYKTVSSNWADEKATYTYNKSLTNHMINNANNAAFNAEVEYVLYGSTNEENLKSAYANIYEIRLALNLASGYLNFWSAGKNTTADVINGAADLIAEITRHIIPAPVTKAVLIALLAALESIQDMKILNKGIPLEVYKVSDEQWSYSINKKGDSKDDVGISDPKSPKKGEGICMQYSDYLFIFLYSMFQSGDDKTNKAYCRLGRLIEANMQKVDKDHPQFSLKQSKTLFTLTSEIDVSPLMMDQPLASDYKDSLADGSWNRYTIEVTRGY